MLQSLIDNPDGRSSVTADLPIQETKSKNQGAAKASRAGAPDFWGASYLPALDGLRTLSFLLVVGYHTRTDLSAKHSINGVLGVGFFFVISGFLITTLLLREQRDSGAISIRNFYTRRVFRIVPMYVFTLLVYGSLATLPSQYLLRQKLMQALPYDLTLRNEYIPTHLDVPFTHSWSLSLEEKFYLLWPWVMFFLVKRSKLGWAIAPISLLPILMSPSGHVTVGYFSILVGCGVAMLLEFGRRHRELIETIVRRVPTFLCLALWISAYLFSLNSAWPFVSAIGTAIILPKLLIDKNWLSKAFGARVLQWTGKRTYSMYLLHAICLAAVQDHLLTATTNARYLAVVALTFGLSLAIGSLTYSFIETPFIRFARRLAHTRDEETAGRKGTNPSFATAG